jgi:hypothetical protein
MVPQTRNHGIPSNGQVVSAPSIAQAPPMAQALPVAQTTHANVLVDNTKEFKFIMLEKFDGTRSKFPGLCNRSIFSCGFIFLVILMIPPKLLVFKHMCVI